MQTYFNQGRLAMVKNLLVFLFAFIMLLMQGGAIAREAALKNEQEAVQTNKIEEITQLVQRNSPEAISPGPTAGERIMEQDKQRLPLLVGIMSFTFLCLLSVLLFLYLTKKATAEIVFNVTGLILVIQAILFMAMASLTSEQLTSTIGALGAIAGYLFGRATKQDSGKVEAKEN